MVDKHYITLNLCDLTLVGGDGLVSIKLHYVGCYGFVLLLQRIRATADGSERKYLMRDLNIIEKSKGCPYIVTFYGVLLKEVS